MNRYFSLLIFLFNVVRGDIGAVKYQGCFRLPGSTPGSQIVVNDMKEKISYEKCLNEAASVNAQAFGIRLHTWAKLEGYCYYGPLSAFTAYVNVSTVPNCDESCPGTPSTYPCGTAIISGTVTTYTSVVYSITYCNCCNTSWSDWSGCSQTCGYGVRNRNQILNNGTSCNSTKIFEYQSCNNTATCRVTSTAETPLKTQCENILNGYYAYSSCYFLSDTTDNPTKMCSVLDASLASFFGTDLVSQLGSVFLRSDSVISSTSLQYVSGDLKWLFNGTYHRFLSNVTIEAPAQSCISLVSNKNSSGDISEFPHLNHTLCSSAINAMCMKYDNIYSSYKGIEGKLIMELQSAESATTELDSHACGARCSRIISCLGFNYRQTDQSCIPTKVSYRTPMTISGSDVYSITDDPDWIFYDRI